MRAMRKFPGGGAGIVLYLDGVSYMVYMTLSNSKGTPFAICKFRSM